MNDNTGLIFIHGAGLGSFIWENLTPYIKSPFKMIEFPNRNKADGTNKTLSLNDYTMYVVKQIENWEVRNFIIVAHSIGGVVGLKLADYFGDRISGFISIGAAIPANGNSFMSCFPFPENWLMPIILKLMGTRPPASIIKKGLCNDLSETQANQIIEKFTPESSLIYTQKTNNKMPKTKSLYIKLSKDQGFPTKLQDKMAENMNANHIVNLDSGHLPMISKPEELATIINRFVKE